MPEGDTIHRAAANLRKVLNEQQIIEATGRRELLSEGALNGCTVIGIEARGKHLMIYFDDNRVLHSHMGMTGSWHIYRLQDEWQKPSSQAVVVLKTDRWCVVCFTPRQIELVTFRQLSRDPYLQRLGPDILGPPISDGVTVARFRSQNPVAIGEAVMNQTVLSGIGNVYKSEILFCEGIHPLTLVGELSDQQLLKIRDRAVFLMRRNLENKPRRTRFRADEQSVWVYGRGKQDCLRCGEAVQVIRQGHLARSTYFCPRCQVRTKDFDPATVETR